MSGRSLLPGMVPISITAEAGQLQVDWCYFGDAAFLDPMFTDCVNRQLDLPFNRYLRPTTDVSALSAVASEDCLDPSGFIFHLSRCGSTLLSRMLAASDQHLVLSEPSLIDTILNLPMGKPTSESLGAADQQARAEAHRAAWLRDVLRSLARKRNANWQRLFVKCDMWQIGEIHVLRAAFPKVPWIFLYRDPLEVLQSNLNQRAHFMMPEHPRRYGMDLNTAISMDEEEFVAHKLSQVMLDALHAFEHTSGGILMHYNELPEAGFARLCAHFGLTLDASERARALQTCTTHSKRPGQTFVADSQAKRSNASPAAIAACDTLLMPHYAALEALRLKSG
jgi:hypothetical protein